ncbi:MAG: aminotransferase class I/II-fold pyridoxal phosphate-dependent enzyme [bacterium]|nr:aminotransferase class I/II-fold pyridoxal phosphate-dependent enzyme [bacterium]
MKIETFHMERMQSTWENIVEYNMSESGVHPVSLKDLFELGLDMSKIDTLPLGYGQSNGTIELRKALTKLYPGSTVDHIEVTNGSSEANFILCLTLIETGDDVLFQKPNYMQVYGVPRSLGAEVKTFSLVDEKNWEPDWKEFDNAISEKTKFIYISNPNNPTGSVLSRSAMERIVEAIEKYDAYLIADEVYQGAELEGDMTPSFWGMSDRVFIVSGLSKAYGIPGLRIGWIIGDPDIVAEAWSQHDYITIGPNILSDCIAQIAVREENRQRLYARTREILGENRVIFKEWVDSFGDFFEYTESIAGPIAYVKYDHEIPSVELVERIRDNQDVLIVPGTHFGTEGYLRIALGSPADEFKAALGRIKTEIEAVRAGE